MPAADMFVGNKISAPASRTAIAVQHSWTILPLGFLMKSALNVRMVAQWRNYLSAKCEAMPWCEAMVRQYCQ